MFHQTLISPTEEEVHGKRHTWLRHLKGCTLYCKELRNEKRKKIFSIDVIFLEILRKSRKHLQSSLIQCFIVYQSSFQVFETYRSISILKFNIPEDISRKGQILWEGAKAGLTNHSPTTEGSERDPRILVHHVCLHQKLLFPILRECRIPVCKQDAKDELIWFIEDLSNEKIIPRINLTQPNCSKRIAPVLWHFKTNRVQIIGIKR